jgi:hypothetical protein
MLGTSRRRYAVLGAACALIAGGIAAGLVLAFSGSPAAAAPTKEQYFAQVAAICRKYGPKLDKIPPPIDVSIPSELWVAARKAFPVLQAESSAVRRLTPPRELRSQLARWIKLNDASISELAKTLAAAKQLNLQAVQVAYVSYVVKGAKAQHLGKSIGFPSPPC